jgi:hypothetical protein
MGYEVAQSNAAWMYSKGLGVAVKEEGWPNVVRTCYAVVMVNSKPITNNFRST